MSVKNKNAARIVWLILLLACAALSVCIGVGVGTVHFSVSEIIRALWAEEDSAARLLIWNLRLPRVLCGGLTGICLSLSGCILQGVMRNTMASPSTIGVTSGAGFIGYLTLAAFPAYGFLLPVGSVLGAFCVTMLIYLLAYQRGVSPVKMILAGMAVSALFGAFNDTIRLLFADSLGNASAFLVGGFNGCGWESFYRILPYAACGIFVCCFLPSKMNVLMLGDETASSLGLHTELFRFVLIAVSSLLAGAAISVGGMIGFVGLIVPHIARLLVGSDHTYLFPVSACLGFVLLALCDTLGRVLLPAGEIPVGIILSLLGAPFFLWLLRSREKGGGE